MTEISRIAPTTIHAPNQAEQPASGMQSVSSPSQQSTPAASASSFETVKDTSNAPQAAAVASVAAVSPAAAARVRAAVSRVGDIITKNLVKDGESATFSAAGVTALMMFAANGTKPGEQRDAYLKALGFEGMSIDEVNAAGKAFAADLGAMGDDIKVAYANMAITNQTYSGGFTDSFTADASKGVSTTVIDKAYAPNDGAAVEAVTKAINTFVEDNTEHLIKNFMSTDTVADINWYLLSCAAFKAKLTTPFVDPKELAADPGFTKRLSTDKDFATAMQERADQINKYNPKANATAASNAADTWKGDAATYCGKEPWDFHGESIEDVLPTLQAEADKSEGRMRVKGGGFNFFENDRCTAAKIPYGEYRGASIIVMQPKGDETPKSLLSQIGTTAFAEQVAAKSRPSYAEDTIEMYPFDTTFKPASTAVLETFNEIAPCTFDALTKSGSTSPNDAIIQAVINFGARETVAGQVAGMGMLESAISFQVPPPITFKVNGPFAYVIVSKSGDEIWRGIQG